MSEEHNDLDMQGPPRIAVIVDGKETTRPAYFQDGVLTPEVLDNERIMRTINGPIIIVKVRE